MEAKDTVLYLDEAGLIDSYSKYREILERQAEISFKAGYDKRDSEFVYNPDYLDFRQGVEEGRREVVGWVEMHKSKRAAHSTFNDASVELCLLVRVRDWEGQCKKWGIEQISKSVIR